MENDELYRAHIIEAIERIERFTVGMDYEHFRDDDKTIAAVVRQFEIIGEAVKSLSIEFTRRYPSIPWQSIAGMRDKLIHQYFGVDVREVWHSATVDIPKLKKTLTGE
ncbi:hypothetical protein A3J43_00865 [Candidatus Uhrbacteria bacterium RIFCSPHIGHO2_12_FULL_54_23]|uniref:DUF86 domain-containing protein n=3 Tax=Candidatus Uhriibacteriota TaxID=1752732 RepID=A0A1F7UMH5_9BACT|nr:MAG: hypothetical protein A3J43_00865 [Candidatus Uhrbacteria bacterium RIFCSPHIGHO2_12_FULL_54_23]OGL85561.1 MAG: hypothetical protein A3B36_00700 [Candidatus Uhrbacteria bacterium RIFCSPLOWO2_01_FULL_55_36]OGL90803.1 MAG: hypothetical protein A3J36_03420 [Candidatus Uhrbacteria bacterium RIFCSPLOWO2_02_FULL_54_37]